MPLSIYGDVWQPTALSGFAAAVDLDFDNNGRNDLFAANTINSGISNNTDPTGATGTNLRWNHTNIWLFWDQNVDAEIGRNSYGRVTSSGGDLIQPQHLTIGGNTGSVGIFNIQGSTFSNTRQNVSAATKLVTRLGQSAIGSDAAAFWASVAAVTYDDVGDFDTGATFPQSRRPKGSWNVWAGKDGRGTLDISAGSTVEIEHQLLIGGKFTSTTWGDGEGGHVLVDGSTLIVYGVAYASSSADPTNAPASYIGTGGVLDLTGATVQFRQGLTNTGMIIVRKSTTPTVFIGDLTNRGTVYVESGATLIYSGTYSEEGLLVRGQCPNVIVGIDGEEAVVVAA